MKKTCFVIMPFGKKKDASGNEIDFDETYVDFIKDTVEAQGMKCVRCDEIDESGWIHKKMITRIYEADLAIVDITTLNPNVFYELGVRHALVPSGTILIQYKEANLIQKVENEIPFNIQDFNVVRYGDKGFKSVKESRDKLIRFIQNSISSAEKDSLVHEVLDLKIGAEIKPERLKTTKVHNYKLKQAEEKRICLITGDINDVKVADIWVNSENTNMQMARHFDNSISGVIRYLGAKKKAGHVIEDTIAEALAEEMHTFRSVPAGTILMTESGELKRTHNVKKIFHAAAVSGEFQKGYRPIEDVGMCVRNALAEANSNTYREDDLRSILFPLMGTGASKGALEIKARELIEAALSYLENNPECTIEKVYFLTWTDKELAACQRILEDLNQRVEPG